MWYILTTSFGSAPQEVGENLMSSVKSQYNCPPSSWGEDSMLKLQILVCNWCYAGPKPQKEVGNNDAIALLYTPFFIYGSGTEFHAD